MQVNLNDWKRDVPHLENELHFLNNKKYFHFFGSMSKKCCYIIVIDKLFLKNHNGIH